MWPRRITFSVLAILFLCLTDSMEAKNDNDPGNKPKKPKINKKDVKSYLLDFGYVDDMEPTAEGSVSTQNTIKRFQKRAGLKQTGEMDDPTLEAMAAPRCGNPDEEKGSKAKKFKPEKNNRRNDGKDKRFVAYRPFPWSSGQTLTYRVLNGSTLGGLSFAQVENIFARAFGEWASVTDLKFAKTTESNSDFTIYFANDHIMDVGYYQGEPCTWSTPTVLAHAFYPGSSMPGQCHVCDKWNFTDRNPTYGEDLFEIVVHEIGHNLGLSHSDDPEAIMAPFYQYHDGLKKMHWDDIMGAHALYGKPSNAKPFLCHLQGKVDAVFERGNFIYVFQGHEYYIFNKNGQIEPGFPREVSADFVYPYKGVSSAALIPAGILGANKEQIYFFVKNILYIFESNLLVRTIPLENLGQHFVGINTNNLNRFESSAYANGKLLLVYDEYVGYGFNRLFTCLPQSTGTFNCVKGPPVGDQYPTWCVGAVNIGNDELLFVKDTNNYFKKDKTTKKISGGGTVVDFFRCNDL